MHCTPTLICLSFWLVNSLLRLDLHELDPPWIGKLVRVQGVDHAILSGLTKIVSVNKSWFDFCVDDNSEGVKL